MRASALATAALFIATSLGCSDDGEAGRERDASLDGGSSGTVAIPWLAEGAPPVAWPRLTPCPAGWRERSDDDITWCDPWPEGGPQRCALGQAHFPGEPACAPVGDPCPADEWPRALPTDREVLYVRPGATGGDGTRDRPFGTVPEAMVAVRPGGVLALAKGTYDSAFTFLRDGVTVWGACAGETLLTSAVSSTSSGVVNAPAGTSELRNVRIGDSARMGVTAANAGTTLRLEGVIVSNALLSGIAVVAGARLEARALAVQAIRADPAGNAVGLYVDTRSQAAIARVVIQDTTYVAIQVSAAGSILRMEGAAVMRTQPAPTGQHGHAVVVVDGAAAEISDSVADGNHDAAFIADGAGTSLRLEGCVVRDTQPRADGTFGEGARTTGAASTVLRTLVANNHGTGLDVGLSGSMHVEDVIVTGTQADATTGNGLETESGGQLDVARAVIEHSHGVGVDAFEGGIARLEDVVIRNTEAGAGDRAGYGLSAGDSSTSIEGARVVLEHNRKLGILAADEGSVVLEDVLVRDTQPETSGQFGRALHAQHGGTVVLRRALLDRNREAAVTASFAATAVRLEDVVVRDTMERACAATTCAATPAGFGVASYLQAAVTLERFMITRTSLCGVHVASDGGLDLHWGDISMAAIGACVQVPDYDVARLNDRVSYRDNGVNLQSSMLPVPEGDVELPPR